MTKRSLGIMGLLASVAVVTGCANMDPEEMESEEDLAAMEDGMDIDATDEMDPGLDTEWYPGLGLGGCGLAGLAYPYGWDPLFSTWPARLPVYALFTSVDFGCFGCGASVSTTVVTAGGCGGCGGCRI